MNAYFDEMNSGRDLELRDRVMERVRTIRTMREILNPRYVKSVVFVASIATTTLVIHIAAICDNMSHLSSIAAYPGYIYGAFLHTSAAVQAFIVLALVAGAWMAADVARNAISVRAFGHIRRASA